MVFGYTAKTLVANCYWAASPILISPPPFMTENDENCVAHLIFCGNDVGRMAHVCLASKSGRAERRG